MTATTLIPLPTIEMVTQFRAFGPVDLNPALCTKDVLSKAGNVILPEGAITWANGNIYETDFVSVWTADTHYAGVKSSTVPSIHLSMVDGARVYCGWGYVATDAGGQQILRFNRSFTELVTEVSNLVVSGYYVVNVTDAEGNPVDADAIPPSWMLRENRGA